MVPTLRECTYFSDCFPHLNLNLPASAVAGHAMNIFQTLSFQCDGFIQMWQFQAYQSGTVFICTLEPQGVTQYKLTSKTRLDVTGAGIYNHTYAAKDMIRIKTGDIIATMYLSKTSLGVIPYADSRQEQSLGSVPLSRISQHIYKHDNNVNIGDIITKNTVSWTRLPAIRAYILT